MGGVNVKITMAERLINKVAPYPCLGCGSIAEPLCLCCLNDIVSDMYFACWECHLPSRDGVCGNHRASNLDAFWVAGWRENLLKVAIDTYKFKGVRRLVFNLAKILNHRIPVLPPETLVVPLPTRPSSVRLRGYNHTLLLAKVLAELRGLELSQSLLLSKSTEVQHFSNKKDRQEQIQGAFMARPLSEDLGRPHLIVDDIVTTGSTLLEAHKTLVGSGVETVWLTALARQPLD